MNHIRQLVVLVGGKGTRLGTAGQHTPKPLMPISDSEVFLDHLLKASLRQGFGHVILLAGHLGEQVVQRYAHRRICEADIDVFIEPSPMGTGGALRMVESRLADSFILMNGDTLFDINLRALDEALASDRRKKAVMALRRVDDAGRYGSVSVDGDGRITGFREKQAGTEGVPGMINGGIYALRREVLAQMPAGACSIETDVFPDLVERGELGGRGFDGYFLDIGLPETLQTAREDLPGRKRPVLFLDRDGVLNADHGYVSSIEQWEWIPGARRLIRSANDAGIAVVVVTNQAGVARGYYDEGSVRALHFRVQQQLHAEGAFIDGFYYCPDHPDAVIDRYRVTAPYARKPDPAMLARAARQLDLDLSRGLLIGDQASDLAAASALGVPSLRYEGGDLAELVLNSEEWRKLI
ncbi:MAG: HAD-IIIA family hydrolase [Sphingomonadales bacterium]|nr:HAD-IIIA family hydrolase [Sphingomonadales bacterium]